MNDAKQRQQALDPNQSFIVQAPAGSGKTEILTQRFLVLLATVQQPEEIIALTFTRKAAAEMRLRLLQALRCADQRPQPEAAHAKKTWQLARQALQQNKKQQWDLLNNPNRLRIQTIDALCANLTKQMPLLSHFGAQPRITEEATPYYAQAARATLANLEANHPWNEALSLLLLHLDNYHTKVEQLFINMLARRDQWLPHILHAKNSFAVRKYLENNLQSVTQDALTKVAASVPTKLQTELAQLARFAANMLDAEQIKSPITNCFHLEKLPGVDLSSSGAWAGLATLLLTKEKTWRKQVNKNIGFPATSNCKNPEDKRMLKAYKQRMLELLDACRDSEVFRENLAAVMDCPPQHYQEQQWQIVAALIELLPVLAAQLKLVFQQHGVVDFTEIASSALEALGENEAPTDLALYLDYKIQHLLIDEFQDTSVTQFRLLEKLTSQWQNDDGRSLFLVGDPMQSIYRFREAEVGLFLQAVKQGIGPLKLTSLTLHANFRSTSGIVDWVNQIFQQALPKQENATTGAVAYSPSTAMHAATDKTAVHLQAFTDEATEAQQIVKIIQQQDPQDSLAILVRSRSHLFEIIPALQQAKIDYQAVEIEPLAFCAVIQDLWALTRALLHLADRLAWLTVLRAPWCGLTLADLHALAAFDHETTIWQQLLSLEKISHLTNDGQQRLIKLRAILQPLLANRRRINLAQALEKAWLALGGPTYLTEKKSLSDAKTFFELLHEFSVGGDLADYAAFEAKLANLFAASRTGHSRVQIMTIHKAKGLEFDTVILPELSKRAPYPSPPLLMWAECPTSRGAAELLLAPIPANLKQPDAIYQFLRQQESQKSYFETGRLLYVAVTRAKKYLHLLTCSDLNEDKALKAPSKNSLLAQIWPQVDAVFNTNYQTGHSEPTLTADDNKVLQRLPSNWQTTINSEQLFDFSAEQNPIPREGFIWHATTTQHLGTFIHRILKTISEQGVIAWQQKNLTALSTHWRQCLLALGIAPSELDTSVAFIIQTIHNTLQDARGQWLLQPHQSAQSEWPISAVIDNKIQHMIIDRTFIDEKGVRWIVDYKTGPLQKEHDAYIEQLQQYAQALQGLDENPIRLALYFPIVPEWVEYSPVIPAKTGIQI